MLMELTVLPLGRGLSISSDIAPLIDFIDRSGMPYQATAFGTLVEGTFDQLMGIVKTCHELNRAKTRRAIVLIRLDDFPGKNNLLATSVAHVEQRLGHRLISRLPDVTVEEMKDASRGGRICNSKRWRFKPRAAAR